MHRASKMGAHVGCTKRWNIRRIWMGQYQRWLWRYFWEGLFMIIETIMIRQDFFVFAGTKRRLRRWKTAAAVIYFIAWHCYHIIWTIGRGKIWRRLSEDMNDRCTVLKWNGCARWWDATLIFERVSRETRCVTDRTQCQLASPGWGGGVFRGETSRRSCMFVRSGHTIPQL